MRIEHLELQNFCQHRRVELTAGNGLIAIIGPNGSGKSNLLGAARMALTGDNPNAGKKADNISQFAIRGERSYVKLRFSHGGVTATVTRNLNPATPAALLEEDGKPTLSGDTLVTSRICEILGTTVEVINDIVIVAQDDIFGFLEKTPTKRAEQFQRLFRTDAAAPLYDFLNKQAAKMSCTAPYTPEQIGAMRAELTREAQHLAEAAAALAASPTLADCDAAISRWEAVVNEAATAARLHADHAATQARLSQGLLDVADLSKAQEAAQQRVDALAASVDTHHAAEVAAQATLAAVDVYTRHAASVAAAAVQRRQVAAQQAALVAPTQPPGYFIDTDIDARLGELTSAWNVADNRYKSMCHALSAAVARCPSCQTAADPRLRFAESGRVLAEKHGGELATEIDRVTAMVPVTAVDVSELERQRAALVVEMNYLSPQISATHVKQKLFREYDAATQAYNQRVQALTAQLAQIDEHLRQLGTALPPTGDHEAATAACRAATQARADLAAARSRVTAATQALATLQGGVAALQDAATKQAAVIAAIPADLAANGESANNALAAWRRQRDARRGDEQALETRKFRHGQLQEQLALAEEMAAKVEENLAWRDYVSAMAALVHCNAAPRFVAQQNLQQLQRAVNDYLAMFQAEFRVVADEGLSFTAHFNDGVRRQAAERLSGGQKVVLALSFRLATNLQLAAGIGGLYLDEPTAYLDKTHIRGFEPALARLRQFCASRGFQCIIVTHETGLRPLFDSVIDLGATAA